MAGPRRAAAEREDIYTTQKHKILPRERSTMMIMPSSQTLLVVACCLVMAATFLPSSLAFVAPTNTLSSTVSVPPSLHHATLLPVVDFVALADSTTAAVTTSSSIASLIPFHDYSSTVLSSSDMLLSLATLDPTTLLSDILGGLLGSSAILAVPILAALTIVAVIAALIVGYANPADED